MNVRPSYYTCSVRDQGRCVKTNSLRELCTGSLVKRRSGSIPTRAGVRGARDGGAGGAWVRRGGWRRVGRGFAGVCRKVVKIRSGA